MQSNNALQLALDIYHDALIRGLCHDGALEVALGAGCGICAEDLLHKLEQPVKPPRAKPVIRIKRAYKAPTKEDGPRVLIDRLWPRGVSKQNAKIDEWFKDLAPSASLRKWFGHDPARWMEFQKRYQRELKSKSSRINELLSLADKNGLTLIYAAKDEEHNNAVALRAVLLGS